MQRHLDGPVANDNRLLPRRAEGPRLSARERQVLECLCRGRAYKQAADELGISIDTVRAHIRRLYHKLRVHSVSEAVGKALREGLV
jgi:DNA-binding CsgD family transcriptional regulator